MDRIEAAGAKLSEEDYEYDLFISHASEDKKEFVAPLANALRAAGLDVWYDKFTLEPGDSLRESIDRGLYRSRFGVVVLSRSFFEKRWPARELAGLTALEMGDGQRRIIPIWLGVTVRDVARYSPPLADTVAIDGREEIAEIVRRLVARVVAGTERVAPQYNNVLRDQDVDIVALAREIGHPASLVSGYAFQRCRLIGPGVLALGDHTHFNNVTFHRDQWIPISDNRRLIGVIPIASCLIDSCVLDRIGIITTEKGFSRAFYAMQHE